MSISKEHRTIAPGVNSLWRSPQTNGKLRLLCLSCPTCSCGAACSQKEVNWMLIYTNNIHKGRRYGCSGALQRRNPCVKPASDLTIYGNMCLLEQKQIVSRSLPRSFLVYSEDLSKIRFDNPIQGLRLWLAIEVRYHYDCYVSLLFEYNHRFATLIRTHWIHRLQRWWQNWTSLSLFCIVLLLQAMLLQWWLI